MGETIDKHLGFMWETWEVSAAPCTAQKDTGFKLFLSHLKIISKTCHGFLPKQFSTLNAVLLNKARSL